MTSLNKKMHGNVYGKENDNNIDIGQSYNKPYDI